VAIQHVEFLERVFVEEIFEALSRGHATLGAVTLNRFFSTGNEGLGFEGFEFLQTFGHRVFHSVRLARTYTYFLGKRALAAS
jgi:hypothetical protein